MRKFSYCQNLPCVCVATNRCRVQIRRLLATVHISSSLIGMYGHTRITNPPASCAAIVRSCCSMMRISFGTRARVSAIYMGSFGQPRTGMRARLQACSSEGSASPSNSAKPKPSPNPIKPGLSVGLVVVRDWAEAALVLV